MMGVLASIGTGWYFLEYALRPANRGRDVDESYRVMFETYPGLNAWVDSLRCEEALRDTFVQATDGACLHGLFIPAQTPTGRTAVVVHGYTDNAVRMLMIAQLYHQALGFNVLLPDLRNSGLSDGDVYSMGWLDRPDLHRWLAVADGLGQDSSQLVLHGISMGAAAVMMLSGDGLPATVKCVVEDCGYTDVWTQFVHVLKLEYGLPAFPIVYMADALCRLRYGWNFREASPLQAVQRATVPILFIHSDADAYVPSAMVHSLYAAKKGEKSLWTPPHSPHAMSYRDHRKEYTERVKTFVQQYVDHAND